MTWDPNAPDKLHAQGWGSKLPTGWGAVVFLVACAVVAAALVIIIR